MEMPHGVLLRSFNGPIPLNELNAALSKDLFTGYVRASVSSEVLVEGVLVYSSGKPIVAFTTNGKTDLPDNDLNAITSVTAKDDSAIELFSLSESQIKLVLDFFGEFILRQQPPPPPPPKPQPVVREPQKPLPVQKPKPQREEKPLGFPEVRGTFAKSENVESLRSYVNGRKDETGHVILIKQDEDGFSEYHLLLLKGKAVAAYSTSPHSAGTAYPAYGMGLLDHIMIMGGMVEFYYVDEPLVNSIVKMYPHITVTAEAESAPQKIEPSRPEQKTKEVLRPDGRPYVASNPVSGAGLRPESITRTEAAAHGIVTRPPERYEAPKKFDILKPSEMPKPLETIKPNTASRQGLPSKSIFEKGDSPGFVTEAIGTPAPESRSTGTLKGDMDDDADFVKKVEKEFVGNVDELLKRLELSHLKVVPEKKKRQ
jgi:hypothetical protein